MLNETKSASFKFHLLDSARALLPPEKDNQWLERVSVHFAERCAVRDLVRLPPSRLTLQVVSRIWTMEESGEQLLVVLDLAPGEPILGVV